MPQDAAAMRTAAHLYASAAALAHLVGEHRFHRSTPPELEGEFAKLAAETCDATGEQAGQDVSQMLYGYIDIAAAHDSQGRSCRICSCGLPVDATGTGLEANLTNDLAEACDLEQFSWDIGPGPQRHPSRGRVRPTRQPGR